MNLGLNKMELTDNCPMPFGKYKNVEMANVPADYLLWLTDKPVLAKFPQVKEYIKSNKTELEKECLK